jgi:muramoyltetrapeptide carboxypeptidase
MSPTMRTDRGKFELIGCSNGCGTTGAHGLRRADALRRSLAHLRCPALVDVDIGHKPPQLTLINAVPAGVAPTWEAAR